MSRFILELKKHVAELELLELKVEQEDEISSAKFDRLFKEEWSEFKDSIKEGQKPICQDEYNATGQAISEYCYNKTSTHKNLFLMDKKIEELNELVNNQLEHIKDRPLPF